MTEKVAVMTIIESIIIALIGCLILRTGDKLGCLFVISAVGFIVYSTKVLCEEDD